MAVRSALTPARRNRKPDDIRAATRPRPSLTADNDTAIAKPGGVDMCTQEAVIVMVDPQASEFHKALQIRQAPAASTTSLLK
jgi:hypothetical protein